MMKYKTKILFIIILFIAAGLRFYQLGNVPISPDWDEVALGYNAYSILHTSRDEYGEFLPIVLRSFDDYKPALYAYLIIPFLPLFDLNVFTVRFPSALMGVITVGAVYFLVKELLGKRGSMQNTEIIALLSALLLAISPWHLQFSRVAFEANVGLGFNILMAYFFLKGIRSPKFFSLSVICAALSLYTYQSEKVFTPLLMLALIIIYNKKLREFFKNKSTKKYLFLAVIAGAVVMIPFMQYTLTHPEVFARARGVSILSDKTSLLEHDIPRLARDKERNDYLGMIFDNRRVTYAKIILGNYLSHFNMGWLFITGDYNLNRHHAPGMGLEYIVFLPFLFIGIYQLVFGQFDKKTKLLIFLWCLLVPIPAAITKDVPHAVRTLNFLPTLQIFIALGLLGGIKVISNFKHMKNVIYVIAFSLFVFNFVYYLNQYFVQQNHFYSLDWQYGYKEIIEYIKPIQNKYSKIIVSNEHEQTQSHMFFLFYLKYDPKKYLQEGGTKSGRFAEKTNKFANFEFRPFNYYDEKGNVLFVGGPSAYPEEFSVIKTVNYLDGKQAMKIVEKD